MKIIYTLIFVFLVSCSGLKNSDSKSSVMGEDSDKDGVRDDIQTWIDDQYNPNSRVRLALREIAKIHPASCDYKYSVDCLESVVGLEKRIELEVALLEMTLNSEERREEYESRLANCPAPDLRFVSSKCNF